MTKKSFAWISLFLIAAFALAACGAPTTEEAGEAPAAAETEAMEGGEVYYLNFKPEVAELYQQIAEVYKQETGVTLKVVTAAAGTYEQTLKSEIAKADAPVLFQLNGPIGYEAWKDYTADLKDTELYKHLSNKSMAVTVGDGVYGIPYVVEGYGIIYNNAIMTKYFALEGAKAKSMEEINKFRQAERSCRGYDRQERPIRDRRCVFFYFSETWRRLALANSSRQCPDFLRVPR